MTTHNELHSSEAGSTLNWLRAAVLGANDGVVSVASIVVGVAGASNSASFILTAGVAGLVAGALSMAVGEYVSVSTQRDTERAQLQRMEVGIVNEAGLTNPWHAAWASGLSFFSGAIFPLGAISFAPADIRIPTTFAAVLVVLIITGTLSAHVGGANKTRATVRVVIGGMLAMAITFGIGKLFGVVGI